VLRAVAALAAGELALQAHDPQAEEGQPDRHDAGPGPHPVDPIPQQEQDDEGDGPQCRPGEDDPGGVDLQGWRGLLRGSGHGVTLGGYITIRT